MIAGTKKSLLGIALFAAIVLSLLGSASAYATAPEQQLEPTQEQIDAIKAKANTKPIYKESNGALVLDEESNRAMAVAPRSVELGEYPRRKGTILVTDDKFSGLIPTGHAAIVYGDGYDVVEALGEGVVIGANDWDDTHGNIWRLATINLSFSQADVAADWCGQQVGKPYNYNFLDTMRRDAFYCSQLVWASFYDNFGVDISTPYLGSIIYPIEFLESDECVLMYRRTK